LFFATLLSACASASAEPDFAPTSSFAENWPDCEWGERIGAGISVWSFECADDRLVADEALPGFYREQIDASGRVTRWPVIRVFTKAPDAPIEAILPAVRAISPEAETCVFVRYGEESDPDEITPGFLLTPRGDTRSGRDVYDQRRAESSNPPCGLFEELFQIVEGAPHLVVYVDNLAEYPLNDRTSIRAYR